MSQRESLKSGNSDGTTNKQGCAAHFNVSLPTIDAWVRKGAPVVQRGGSGVPWQLDLSDIARWLESRGRKPSVSQRRLSRDALNCLEAKAVGALRAAFDEIRAELSEKAESGRARIGAFHTPDRQP